MKTTDQMIRGLAVLALVLASACAKRELPGDAPSTGNAWTSQGARIADPPGAIESKLFPPELVMENQGAIGIEPVQREAILKEVERTQSDVLRMQWELNSEKEKLAGVLVGERVDEQKASEAAARVMAIEDRVKAAHLAMLVRVKNLLSKAQQDKLAGARGRR